MVTTLGQTLEIFLVTLVDVLYLILLPVPHWKIRNSKMIPYNGNGQHKQVRFLESKVSNAYPATESDSVPRLMRMLFILG